MITARHAVPSLLPRLGTHHEALMPGLLALLEDHDPRIRRLSLDLIAGVIARVRFDYSWAQPGGILWRETEKAVRNATHSDDEVLAAAAQLVLTEYFSPGNRHRSLPALF
jgi:hypothetical protein